MKRSRSSEGSVISADLLEARGGEISSADGTRLSWRGWLPPASQLTLAVVHGHGEHGGRYEALARAMGEHRIATYAIDLRGHGSSAGARGHLLSWDELLADVAAFQAMVESVAIGEVVPLGHSVGGSVVLSAVIRGRLRPARFVVSSPALRVKARVPGWKLALGRAASRGVPGLSLDTDLNPAHISRDAAVVAAYRSDPLVHAKMSARFYTEWQAANREILERAGEISVPFLATQGDGDEIIDPAGAEELDRRATVAGHRLIVYPGAYHEPYNDRGSERVFADLAAWLTGSAGTG